MSVARLRPSQVDGEVRAPPSKSYTHRFLLAAHLSGRAGRVRGPLVSADTLRTARAIRCLGSEVTLGRTLWKVAPEPETKASERPGRRTVDCGESGTTLRLLTAAAALRPVRYRFVGRGRLPERPMAPLFAALRTLGASIAPQGRSPSLPFEIQGPIHGGRSELAVDASSQFTSALLFALPTVEPASEIHTVGAPVSEPYILASLKVIRAQGVRVLARGSTYRIPGGQQFGEVDATIPGDASSAAYLWALAALTGGRATVREVPSTWPQADLAILDLLRGYGAHVRRSASATTVEGASRRPFRAVLTDAPDLYPLAGVLAAAAPGRSYVLGAAQVTGKESDRRWETCRLIRSMGAKVREVPGGLAVDGVARVRPLCVRGARDHRIVMSASVAAAVADGPSVVADAAAVAKSFPEFFPTLERLGVELTVR